MNKYLYKLFYKANLAITTILYLSFLVYNNSYTFESFLLTFMGIISTVTLLYVVFSLLLSPFTFFKKTLLLVGSLVFISADIILIIDFFIFRLYKFHINAMVLNILFSPEALKSIQIGWQPVVLFIFFILLIITFELYIYRNLKTINYDKQKALNKKINLYMIVPLFFIIIVDKLTYGLMVIKNNKEVLTSFRVIPLYMPLTYNSFAYKYLGLKPNKANVKNSISFDATLNYPRNKINIDNHDKFNILIIASDATRYSAITPAIAPNLTSFKKRDAVDFQNHYSGGYSTRFGIFSLMYGINAAYWFNFLNANKGSVLFDVLNKLDYETNIIFSTSTSWPEFRKTCFVDIQDKITDDFKGVPWKKDIQSSEFLIKTLENHDGKKPFFGFLFMDAPHGYSYPPKFNKFGAKSQNINYVFISKGSKENKLAFARYKNSVSFIDSRFKKIIDTLKKKKMYDNTLIVFTSDHGQEFYEHGYLGHNSAFDEPQIHVPFLVKLPKKLSSLTSKKRVSTMTSHMDFVPTLLTLLGVKNKTDDYSNGHNLFSKSYNRTFSFCNGWNYNAIITTQKTYIFSNRPDELFNNETRDTKSYKLLPTNKINSNLVLDVMNQNKIFLK